MRSKMTSKELLNKILNACYAAGASPKVYIGAGDDCFTVALGHNWMHNATDTGTKYDKLIDDLIEMGAEPCAEIYGSVQRVY